ncbi:MAG TPA: hypothetical protein VFD17_02990 [Clostridia bacterium]|nr:hypothetical protein [Clostridia bacterium]
MRKNWRHSISLVGMQMRKNWHHSISLAMGANEVKCRKTEIDIKL